MPRNQMWTREMDEKLTSLFPHQPDAAVAKEMDLKRDQIRYRASVLGLKKTAECRSQVKGRINLTEEQIEFIRKNYETMTNRDIAKALGLKIQTLRAKIYVLGFLRMEMEYWTEEQVKYLKDNFQEIGDLELAEIYQTTWPKKKTWTKKHIEKKRNYLNLHRTAQELANVTQRNIDQGRLNIHMKGKTNWLTTGPAKEGEIRMYRSCAGVISPRVKVGKCWKWWQRWAWIKAYGPVSKGMVVVFKDSDPFNTKLENLELVTRAESTRRSAAQTSINLTDNYIVAMLSKGKPELRPVMLQHTSLIELKRQQLLLQRTIKDHGKSSTTNN